ncbi:MAG: hypothetical protein ACRD0J_09455 [Acidimicrobiales bacterium]
MDLKRLTEPIGFLTIEEMERIDDAGAAPRPVVDVEQYALFLLPASPELP